MIGYSWQIYFLVTDEFCEEFPHNLIPTPGYWIECSRQKIASDTIWDESESEREEDRLDDEEGDESKPNPDLLLENDEYVEDEEIARWVRWEYQLQWSPSIKIDYV